MEEKKIQNKCRACWKHIRKENLWCMECREKVDKDFMKETDYGFDYHFRYYQQHKEEYKKCF